MPNKFNSSASSFGIRDLGLAYDSRLQFIFASQEVFVKEVKLFETANLEYHGGTFAFLPFIERFVFVDVNNPSYAETKRLLDEAGGDLDKLNRVNSTIDRNSVGAAMARNFLLEEITSFTGFDEEDSVLIQLRDRTVKIGFANEYDYAVMVWRMFARGIPEKKKSLSYSNAYLI